MSSGRGPALGTFITDLQARLEQLCRDDLTRLLLAHAERLPAAARASFLAIFPDPDGPEAVRSARQQPDDDLPLRGRDFATRVAAGDYGDPEEGWDGAWHGRYGWADEEPVPGWVADADALFTEAGEVFLTADAQRAREVYDPLLDLFRPGAPERPDAQALEIWSLDVTDIPETLARYLRCVYETTPAQNRPAALSDAWSSLPWSPEPLTLTQVADTRPDPLADLTDFLPA